MMQMTPPSGAALYKIVLLKPADDLSLAPDKDFGERIFWYDPDPYGHRSGLREVYPQPSPVEVGEVVAALVEKTKTPAPDVHGLTLADRLNFIHRAESIRSEALVSAHRSQGWQPENAVVAGGLLTEAERADLLKGDLAAIRRVLGSPWVTEDASPIARKDDRADLQEHRGDVEDRHSSSPKEQTEAA